MPLKLKFRFEGLDELRGKYTPKIVDRAAEAALNRAARKAKTALSKKVRERYVVKARDIAANTSVSKQGKGADSARMILYSGRRISLMYFDAQEVRLSGSHAVTTKRYRDGLGAQRTRASKRKRELRGVSVRVLKSRGRLRVRGPYHFGAFMAQGRRGQAGGGFNREVFNVGKAKDGRGNVQVFTRTLRLNQGGRQKLQRLTGPAIPQMVGHKTVRQAFERTLERELHVEFQRAMNHFLDKAVAKR